MCTRAQNLYLASPPLHLIPNPHDNKQDLKQYLDEAEGGLREMPTLRDVKRAGFHRLYSEVQRNGGRKLVAARIGLPLKPGSKWVDAVTRGSCDRWLACVKISLLISIHLSTPFQAGSTASSRP